jgi:hypothetical protein
MPNNTQRGPNANKRPPSISVTPAGMVWNQEKQKWAPSTGTKRKRPNSRKSGGGGFFCTDVSCVNKNAVAANVPKRNPYEASKNIFIAKANKEISNLEDKIKKMSGTPEEKLKYLKKELEKIKKKYNAGGEDNVNTFNETPRPNGYSSPYSRKTRKSRKN